MANVRVVLAEQNLTVGQATMATATLRDAASNVLTGRMVSWATSDPSVATVSPAGLVTAVESGSATLTATSEGRTGSATLAVSPIPVASVVVVLTANGSKLVAEGEGSTISSLPSTTTSPG